MALKLDRNLYDTYRQYKTEEKTLVDWFVRTAQKCSGTIFFNNGKASPLSAGNMAIYEILPMAQVIAKHPSVERIPQDVASSLWSVTSKRAQCSLWYKNNTKQNDTETQRLNRTHDYPLAVLHKTAQLLKAKLPVPTTTSTKGGVKSVESNSLLLENYFANLQVEDCLEISGLQIKHAASDKENHDNRSVHPTSAMRKRDVLINEVMMLRYCLLEDMEAIEGMVIQEWMSFLTGSQSLLGASIITNHAISLVTQLESDAYQALDKHEIDPLASIECYGLSDCFKSDERGGYLQPIIRMQHVLAELWSNPKDFIDFIDLYGSVEDLDYFVANANEQKLYEIATISGIRCCHVACITSTSHKNHPEAQSIRLLRWLHCHPDIWRTPERIPLSVAFAGRLEVLTHHMCYDKMDRENNKSMAWYDTTIVSLQEYLKLVNSKSSLVDEFQMNVQEFWIPQCHATIGAMKYDPIRDTETQRLSFQVTTNALHQIAARENYIRIMIGSVMNVHTFELLAYLHDMCKSENSEMRNWPDLDHLEQYHEAFMYSGSKPSKGSKERYGNRMEYECGLSTQYRSTANGRVLNTRLMPQRRSPTDPLSHMFPLSILTTARAWTTNIYEASTVQINLLLKARVVQELLGDTPKYIRLEHDGDKYVIREHAELVKFAAKGEPLRPTQVLALVRYRLHGELEHSDFDFVEFYKGCLHLASMLGHHWQSNSIHADLEKGKLYCAHDIARAVATDVGKAIQSALTCSSLCCKAGARPKVAAVTSIFNEWVQKKGDIGLKRVQKHGCKPRHIRTLPLSFRLKLKEIHKKFGTMDELFTPEQRKGIKWLDRTIVLEDMIRQEFGKKARKSKNGA